MRGPIVTAGDAIVMILLPSTPPWPFSHQSSHELMQALTQKTQCSQHDGYHPAAMVRKRCE